MALIHLDAGVVIGFLDGSDVHHDAARALLADALRAGDRLAMASSAFAECLVGPARQGDTAIRKVRELFDRLPISIVPLLAETAVGAAQLRARHPTLRLPDAIVIATAIQHAADHLATTDRRWPAARALRLKATLQYL